MEIDWITHLRASRPRESDWRDWREELQPLFMVFMWFVSVVHTERQSFNELELVHLATNNQQGNFVKLRGSDNNNCRSDTTLSCSIQIYT